MPLSDHRIRKKATPPSRSNPRRENLPGSGPRYTRKACDDDAWADEIGRFGKAIFVTTMAGPKSGHDGPFCCATERLGAESSVLYHFGRVAEFKDRKALQ